MCPRRLTDADVRAARHAYADGASPSDLAARLGVRPGAIWLLLTGRSYKTAGGPVTAVEQRIAERADRRLRERISDLERQCEELQHALDELTVPPPAFAELNLTGSEMRLLGALMRYPGRVRTYDHLMAAIRSTSQPSTLRTHIHRIRRAAPGIRIDAVAGVGYVGRYVS